MQQAEEAAAEAEAQRHRVLRLEAEGAVVEAQLFERVAQQAVLVRFHRIEAGEDHGLDLFEAGQRFGGGVLVVHDGVADLGVGDGLDVGEEEAHFAGGKLVAGRGLGRLIAQRFHFEDLAVGPQTDLLPFAQPAIDHAQQDDDAAVRVEPGIENQRAQRRIAASLWAAAPGARCAPESRARRCPAWRCTSTASRASSPMIGFDLLANALRFGGRQVDLVDDRNDFQVVMQRQVGVGEGLRLHALGGVHHQQRAFAGLQAARNFVGKIDVAGGVDEVQLVHLAVVGAIVEAHRVGFDGDAALALQVHGIEDLLHHFALRERAGDFQQPVRKRGLAVVDMRNDGEIPDEFAIHAMCGV